MEQLSIDMNLNEKTEADQIYEALSHNIKNPEFVKFLSVTILKDGSISIKAKNLIVAKVKLTKKGKYFEIPAVNAGLFTQNYLPDDGSGEWFRIPVESVGDVLEYCEPLCYSFMLTLSNLGGERFGCCSRYMQCSDEKQCVNPDKIMSFACAYKNNLEAGRIFYGKNKNN